MEKGDRGGGGEGGAIVRHDGDFAIEENAKLCYFSLEGCCVVRGEMWKD